MGVGEGTNEMPEHLLEELRRRPIYYKSEAPKEIQVRNIAENEIICLVDQIIISLVDILCIMEAFVLVKI
jgi:uncharacterized membrane protein